MPPRDELEAVPDRTLAVLADTHDYFTYTKGAWRTLQLAVRRDGLRFSLQNIATESTVSEKDLLARAQRYVAGELASAAPVRSWSRLVRPASERRGADRSSGAGGRVAAPADRARRKAG